MESITKPSLSEQTTRMCAEINELLKNKLNPSHFTYGAIPTNGFGGEGIKILVSVKAPDINNVAGQRVQLVSLWLHLPSLEIAPQAFGGMGGQSIQRKPNKELPDEKWLAMKSVRVPFRKPQPKEDKVLKSISTFVDNYLAALVEHKDVLMYSELVEYSEILNF